MQIAKSVLSLKPDAVCVEVHFTELSPSDYQNLPLAVISRDDLPMEQLR